MIASIARFFVARSRATLGLWALILVVGVAAYTTLLPRDGFPSVDIPLAVVSGPYFVDDIEAVDDEVLAPLRDAATDVQEIVELQTFARANSWSMLAEFDESLSSADGVVLLREALADAALPADVELEFTELNAAKFLNEYDLLVAVYGPDDATAEELDALAAGVAGSLVEIDEVDEAVVEELRTTAVDPDTGQETVRQTSFNEVGIEEGGSLVLRPAVSVGVVSAGSADSLELSSAVESALDELDLGDGFGATISADFAPQIRSQISSLQSNALVGVVAVALVTLLMISWRASIITALFVVTVLSATMIALLIAGISLNTISLFGVILTLGLFVDDSIVIAEATDAFRRKGVSAIDNITNAVRRVGAASVAGTATTVLVFAPMLFISGILGDFIRQLPITVMVALSISLVLSLVVIPVASKYLIVNAPTGGGPLGRVEARLGRMVASLPERGGWPVRIGGVALSIVMLVAGFNFAGRAGFDIFPEQGDADELVVELDFDPGVTLEEAEQISIEVSEVVVATGGELVETASVFQGDERSSFAQFGLTPFRERSVTAPELVEQLEGELADLDGARASVSQISNGPPREDFPFQAQVYGEDVDASLALADEIATDLQGSTLERANGEEFVVVETVVALSDVVARVDGERYVEVRARFDDDDNTALLNATEDAVADRYPAEELVALGLSEDSLRFDFGQESDNEDSFASAGVAFLAALVLMFVLLTAQFRSLLQPLLIFLAIPFSFFGVFFGLWVTGNPLSFFAMLGLIGLIGIAVNNTILLTDFANQERRAGADAVTAISVAVRQRFRPLVTTTITTVAGLLPLALTDPFWEPLAYTIIFGLVSSTFLVLLSFPYYYLGAEKLRDWGREGWRRLRGRGRTPEPAPEPEPALSA
ncbi:MAG: efflux RND transporter permease subunit [Actinomycetota bacterium]